MVRKPSLNREKSRDPYMYDSYVTTTTPLFLYFIRSRLRTNGVDVLPLLRGTDRVRIVFPLLSISYLFTSRFIF